MIKKIILTIVGIILVVLLVLLIIIAYFLIVDIQSKRPKTISQECGITSYKFIGRNVFVLTPKIKNEKEKVILYFHGGSYVAETSQAHWEFLEKLAKDTGYTIILPDYPLAPKYTYEDVFTMIEPLYKEIISKIDNEDLIMMGDSAGGGMALALEEKLGEEGQKLPSKLILISPWLDTKLTNPKIDEVQKLDKDLNKEALKIAGVAYSGKNGGDSYLVNPINGPLDKLKNVIIYTGTYDILNPDVSVLVEKAKEQNVNIIVKEYSGMEHIWIVKDTETEAYDEFLMDLI